jgi:hypothetical protein
VTETEAQLSAIYLDAFDDRTEWTQQDHLNGLKAVFVAGASAQARIEKVAS